MGETANLAERKKALAEKKSAENREVVHKLTITAYDNGQLTVENTEMNILQILKLIGAAQVAIADQEVQNIMAKKAMDEKQKESRIIRPH